MEGNAYRPGALVAVSVVVAVVIVIVAWSAIGRPDDSDLVPLATDQPVVLSEDGSIFCLMASAEGTLAPHPTSGLGLAHPDGDVSPIVWPHGWVARSK
jgi:hypothetical protein